MSLMPVLHFRTWCIMVFIITPKGVPRIFQWRTKGGKVLREGAATPSPSTRGLVEHCELPGGVWGGAPDWPKVSTIFSTQKCLSWHYNIVSCGLSCSHWGPKARWAPLYNSEFCDSQSITVVGHDRVQTYE